MATTTSSTASGRIPLPSSSDQPVRRPKRNPGPSRRSGTDRLSNDDSPGFQVDPVVVMVLSVCFIGSVVMLHIFAKVAKYLGSTQ